MCDELDWMRFREEAYKFNKNREETLLKKWLDNIGYKEPIGYYRDIVDQTMEIYSTRTGLLIGKAGSNVDKLKEMLTEEFRGEWKVKFVEIRGGFVNV